MSPRKRENKVKTPKQKQKRTKKTCSKDRVDIYLYLSTISVVNAVDGFRENAFYGP